MNYAYFNVLAVKAEFELDSHTVILNLRKGKALIEVWKNMRTLLTEFKRINGWASTKSFLWYEWKKFEDVPLNYESTI